MPKVRMPDGTVIDVGTDALLDDDGVNPFVVPPASQTFTAEDVARIRQEEKDKLYSKITNLEETLTGFKDQVGGLTAAEQRRQAAAEEEKTRLEAEARRKEEEELDAKSLIQRREQEWQEQVKGLEQTWEQKFEEERKARETAEALALREREFNELSEYARAQVELNKDKIAPQLISWISGNTQAEIDASVQRAITTSEQIATEVQQQFQQVQVDAYGNPVAAPPVAPAVPAGTRATAGPSGVDPASATQTLTAEQIKAMPMDQYAALRKNLPVSGRGDNRGLFG